MFERLKAWRLERAREANVPPYVVMHDSVLRQLAYLQPTAEDELYGVKGLGPSKIGRYGREVLELLADDPDAAEE